MKNSQLPDQQNCVMPPKIQQLGVVSRNFLGPDGVWEVPKVDFWAGEECSERDLHKRVEAEQDTPHFAIDNVSQSKWTSEPLLKRPGGSWGVDNRLLHSFTPEIKCGNISRAGPSIPLPTKQLLACTATSSHHPSKIKLCGESNVRCTCHSSVLRCTEQILKLQRGGWGRKSVRPWCDRSEVMGVG
mmetsp:Transcript_136133/g.236158  ORF Transcript_136133/g.236158 Transcript_136133/m.236158 type:complete len:186 (-) Transcript_136133:294-851(-)